MNAQVFPEFDKYITPDGEVFHFDGLYKFIASYEGYGMPPIEYITQRGPFQHGESIVDFRLQRRIIQLLFSQKNGTQFDYWEARSELLNFFRPNRTLGGVFSNGTLRKQLPTGDIRDIDVTIERGPTFSIPRSDQIAPSILDTFRFIAADPTFYDPTVNSETWVLSTTDELIFSATFPILFWIGGVDQSINVTYIGTWRAYPEIVIDGPFSGFTITNVSTGEFIKLEYNINAGEQVTISLEYGNKTVISSIYGNIIGSVSADSDLAEFHLAPDPEVVGGINNISLYGSDVVVGVTDVVLNYYTRFIGI